MTAVLIVDDEKAICQSLRRNLQDEDYHVYLADNAKTAMKIMDRNPIDLIITDQNMPGKSGTELLSDIAESHPHTTRFLMSGNYDMSNYAQSINQGIINMIFPKPWDLEDLKLAIRANTNSDTLYQNIVELELTLSEEQVNMTELFSKHQILAEHFQDDIQQLLTQAKHIQFSLIARGEL